MERWKKSARNIAYAAVLAKFAQSPALRGILVNTGNIVIAESSPDQTWGTGLHLHERNAMDKRFWKNDGGLMSEILMNFHHKSPSATHIDFVIMSFIFDQIVRNSFKLGESVNALSINFDNG